MRRGIPPGARAPGPGRTVAYADGNRRVRRHEAPPRAGPSLLWEDGPMAGGEGAGGAPPGAPAPADAALLRDASVVLVRPVVAEDEESLHAFYGRVSPQSAFLRFFGGGKRAFDADIARMVRP